MDILSRLNLEQIDLENQIDRCIEDETPQFLPELQLELESIQRKIHLMEGKKRRDKIKKCSWDLFS